MAYELVYYGNETLKKDAEEITNVDGKLVAFAEEMLEIMHREQGIGLAAPQIDVSKKLVVIDFEDFYGPEKILINPVIKEVSVKEVPYEEGCLSLPGINADIVRPSEILVQAVTREGEEIEFEADGLLARVIQHEVDHTKGVVFIDHLEKYIRDELRPELKKIKKMNRKK